MSEKIHFKVSFSLSRFVFSSYTCRKSMEETSTFEGSWIYIPEMNILQMKPICIWKSNTDKQLSPCIKCKLWVQHNLKLLKILIRERHQGIKSLIQSIQELITRLMFTATGFQSCPAGICLSPAENGLYFLQSTAALCGYSCATFQTFVLQKSTLISHSNSSCP